MLGRNKYDVSSETGKRSRALAAILARSFKTAGRPGCREQKQAEKKERRRRTDTQEKGPPDRDGEKNKKCVNEMKVEINQLMPAG